MKPVGTSDPLGDRAAIQGDDPRELIEAQAHHPEVPAVEKQRLRPSSVIMRHFANVQNMVATVVTLPGLAFEPCNYSPEARHSRVVHPRDLEIGSRSSREMQGHVQLALCEYVHSERRAVHPSASTRASCDGYQDQRGIERDRSERVDSRASTFTFLLVRHHRNPGRKMAEAATKSP